MQLQPIKFLLLLTALLLSCAGWSQTVTGTVTDVTGEPLIGVNILVEGTSSGTVSDFDGNYSVTAENGQTLIFSYTGYATQRVELTGQTTVDIEMSEDAGLLDEVVVIGYGTTNREAVTGAISSVGAEEVTALVTPNLGDAIQGRLAGVQVTSNGEPGDNPEILVRGVGSINFGTGPLIVVDGVPGAGGLNQFDSRDVENITVLKDASSTAVYGSRASNGVLLITTKNGGYNQPLTMTLETTVGQAFQNKRYEGFSTDDYVAYAEALSGIPLARDLDEIPAGETLPYREQQVSYQDALFRDGLATQNSLQFQGGGDRSTFFGSFGYLQNEGVVVGGSYERFNFRINSRHKLTDNGKLRFVQTLTVSNDERNNLPNGLFVNAVQSIPYLPVRNPNNIGGFNGAVQALDSADPRNPVRAAVQDINRRRTTRIFGTAALQWDIIEGLTAEALYSGNNQIFRNYRRDPIYEATVSNPINIIEESRANDFSPLYRGQLTYTRNLDDHYINATLVGEIQENFGAFQSVGGNHTSNDLVNLAGATITGGSSSRSQVVLQSFLGRLEYGYKGRYNISASFRRDGSSILAPGNNIETFPGAAASWRISEEPFMETSPFSTLKLRASYGRTGSLGLGPYTFQAPIIQNPGPVLGGDNTPVLSAFTDVLANDGLRWEITDMVNFGVDFGFFKDRLNASFEYYDREVDNLILDQRLATSVGPNQTTVNIGAMRNQGVEFQLNYFSNPRKEFTWDATLVVSRNTNEVLRLAAEDQELFFGVGTVGQGFTGDRDPTIVRTGDPVFSFFGFQTDGIFQTQAEIDEAPTQENAVPGDIRFVDTDGDGEITELDRVVLGNYLPDFTYGVNFNGKFKGFDLAIFFQGSQGNDIYNGFESLREQTVRLFNGDPDKFLNAWTPENPNTNMPGFRLNDPNNNRRMSDRYLEDGSYLRLKNITLGYEVPVDGISALSRLRLYVSGQNLLTFTNYSGLDPEIGQIAQGLIGFDAGRYPIAQSVFVGAQIGF